MVSVMFTSNSLENQIWAWLLVWYCISDFYSMFT